MRLASLVLTGCLLAGSALTAQKPPPRDPKPAPPVAQPAPSAAESFEAVIGRLEAEAALTPDRPDGYHKLATFYEEKVRKDKSLPPAERWTYVLQGIAATDRALAIAPDHVDSLVFKGILLRHQANLVPDRDQQQALINEANVVRNRALELQKGVGGLGQIFVPAAEPAAAAECDMRSADGMAPVRVGGDIKAPAKVRDARPIYPPEARAEGVQGLVILQVLIAPTGEVVQSCVLRSIPMLDAAAADAVSQWQFTPTEFNGTLVPVIMTVTVNFTLAGGQTP